MSSGAPAETLSPGRSPASSGIGAKGWSAAYSTPPSRPGSDGGTVRARRFRGVGLTRALQKRGDLVRLPPCPLTAGWNFSSAVIDPPKSRFPGNTASSSGEIESGPGPAPLRLPPKAPVVRGCAVAGPTARTGLGVASLSCRKLGPPTLARIAAPKSWVADRLPPATWLPSAFVSLAELPPPQPPRQCGPAPSPAPRRERRGREQRGRFSVALPRTPCTEHAVAAGVACPGAWGRPSGTFSRQFFFEPWGGARIMSFPRFSAAAPPGPVT